MDRTFTINWILINELAVGSPPINLSHLNELNKKGIKSILSLCSEKEAKIVSNGFQHKRYILPDHSYGISPTKTQVLDVLILIEELKKNGPIFLHCKAGVERSPIICLAWLLKHMNLSLDNALEYLKEVHPKTNILPEQLDSIRFLLKKEID